MRRILLFALLLALLFPWVGSAQAEGVSAVAVRLEETAVLLDLEGAVLVDEGVYADIVPLDGALFAASADGEGYALMDGSGAILSEALYDELRLVDDVLMAHCDGGWGLLLRDGTERTDFDFDVILPTGAGGCWALRTEEDGLALVLLDGVGRVRISSLLVLRWGEAGDGLLALQLEDGLWGYSDVEGRMCIPARYDWAGRFVDGCAPVVSEGHWGAIGKDGEWIVPPEYERLEVSGDGFLLASGDAGATVLDARGEVRARYAGAGVWAALVGEGYCVCDGEALRLFSSDGELLETLAPDAAASEGLGGQLILSEGMWGEACVRILGTQARYQDLYPLGTVDDEPVYACLAVHSALYENDLLHEVQLSVDMDSARYGLVSAAGVQLLPSEYTWLGALADDRFLARTENSWQMIDSRGKVYWQSRSAKQLTSSAF